MGRFTVYTSMGITFLDDIQLPTFYGYQGPEKSGVHHDRYVLSTAWLHNEKKTSASIPYLMLGYTVELLLKPG